MKRTISDSVLFYELQLSNVWESCIAGGSRLGLTFLLLKTSADRQGEGWVSFHILEMHTRVLDESQLIFANLTSLPGFLHSRWSLRP